MVSPDRSDKIRLQIAARNRPAEPTLDLIIPVYNEEETIPHFMERIDSIGELLKPAKVRCLFVNDGSRDATLDVLWGYVQSREDIAVVDLSRNFGKEAALCAGLEASTADIAVPIDVDLQDPPELIADFLEKWREGYAVVAGRRIDRQSDTPLKRFTSGAFYRVFNAISDGSVSEVYAWAADCCGEAGPRRCPPDHADEMEPSQIAVQVLRGDAAIAAQETLQLAVAAIDRLNVEGIPDPLSGRKVQGFVANAHGRSAGRIAAMTVRNQNDVGIQNRFEHRLQGLGVDRRKNLADGCAAAIGGDQDRHLFIRQAALAGLAATLARLAIQSARSLVALKHVSLVNFDNALEFRPILACGLQETVPPAEGRIDAKSASTGRFPYRLALGQRHAE